VHLSGLNAEEGGKRKKVDRVFPLPCFQYSIARAIRNEPKNASRQQQRRKKSSFLPSFKLEEGERKKKNSAIPHDVSSITEGKKGGRREIAFALLVESRIEGKKSGSSLCLAQEKGKERGRRGNTNYLIRVQNFRDKEKGGGVVTHSLSW